MNRNRLRKYYFEKQNIFSEGDKVGFTTLELMGHLEAQFKEGMSWDNYGRNGWHIDHICPISSFKFTSYNDKDFKECWSLENLQPLWEREIFPREGQDVLIH